MISRQCPGCGIHLNAVDQFRLCTRLACPPKAVYDKVMATPRGPLQDTENELVEWVCAEMRSDDGVNDPPHPAVPPFKPDVSPTTASVDVVGGFLHDELATTGVAGSENRKK